MNKLKTKVYGPYTGKDGRQRVILVDCGSGKKHTMSYPKYVVQIAIKRNLKSNETIHHIDGDYSNNDLSNLAILAQSEHSRIDAMKRVRVSCKCSWCGNVIQDVNNRDSKQNQAGPFCSKSCVGSYRAYVQNGGDPYLSERPNVFYEKTTYTGSSVADLLKIVK